MDPDAALAAAREATAHLLADEKPCARCTYDLADAFNTLDDWLTLGGYLPKEWER